MPSANSAQPAARDSGVLLLDAVVRLERLDRLLVFPTRLEQEPGGDEAASGSRLLETLQSSFDGGQVAL